MQSTTKRLKLLDLFSGIGGFSLGLENTGFFDTIAFCEVHPFCQKVLAKNWPNVPCFDDVRTLTRESLEKQGVLEPNQQIDAICGGFPCQDISSAGLKIGISGERSGLWSEYFRLIRDLGPRIVFVENVAALIQRGIDRVLSDLASVGYDAFWAVIPACAVGALHERERVWIVAYPSSQRRVGRRRAGLQQVGEDTRRASIANSRECWVASASNVSRDVGNYFTQRLGRSVNAASMAIPDEPLLGGTVHGVSERLDRDRRLEALGNSVVPKVVEALGIAAHECLQTWYS